MFGLVKMISGKKIKIRGTNCCNVVQIDGVVFLSITIIFREMVLEYVFILCNTVPIYLCVCVCVCRCVCTTEACFIIFGAYHSTSLVYRGKRCITHTKVHTHAYADTHNLPDVCVCLWLRFGGVWQSDGWKAGDGDHSLSREI